MNSIRKSWEIEAAGHQLLLREWTFEEEEHTLLTETWKRQAQQHEKDVERRKRDEEQRQEKIRKEWDHEVEEHDRLLKDRRRREEEERQKLNMFWGHVESHQCTTYGTKEYTALLMNLPATWEHRVEACKVTPLEVHGISYLPKSCEDKGPGVVTGRWEINHNEPDCASYWRSYQDKASPIKMPLTLRIEHYLENLPHGGDWREFCATTPVSFHDMHFVGAQECFQYNLGTYGHWEIDDSSC
ncbi:hypothetical protein BS17DRAFT_707398 [Gyrodon lividus]|nr:hypothetical protein BS17DRAFT_707398 [Gyrodon lividus]